jgi:hypothetical protein
MKKIITLFMLVAVTGSFMTSCSKYEEGPKLSLRSKKARLAGEWVVDHYVDASGTSVTPTGNTGVLTIDKDGTFTDADGSGNSYAGTWAFAGDKEQITFTVTAGGLSISSTSTIILLKNKEIAFKDADGDKTYYKAK